MFMFMILIYVYLIIFLISDLFAHVYYVAPLGPLIDQDVFHTEILILLLLETHYGTHGNIASPLGNWLIL